MASKPHFLPRRLCDDEKEEKDDEGYDSYGITASQNHLPESQPVTAVVTNSVREDDFENHDYNTFITYCFTSWDT
jgi:hypothetical protein